MSAHEFSLGCRVKIAEPLGPVDSAVRGTVKEVDSEKLQVFVKWDDDFQNDLYWMEELEVVEEE